MKVQRHRLFENQHDRIAANLSAIIGARGFYVARKILRGEHDNFPARKIFTFGDKGRAVQVRRAVDDEFCIARARNLDD